jgi:LuxR family quorum-sensing system transcriptional regulator SolR
MIDIYSRKNNIEILDKLNDVLGSLRQNGITHFAYNEFHAQGKYSIWCTNLEWMKFYFQHELDQYLIFNELFFDANNTARTIWDLEQDNLIIDKLKSFNVCEGCSVFIRKASEQKLEAFHFGSAEKNIINRLFLNEETIFRDFIEVFHAEMGKDIKDKFYLQSKEVSKKVVFYLNQKPSLEGLSSKLNPKILPQQLKRYAGLQAATTTKEVAYIYQLGSTASIKLRKVTELLLEVGITHFAYNDFLIDGRYSVWCTNLDWVKYYFENNLDEYLFFNELYFDDRNMAKIIWNLETDNAIVAKLKCFDVHDGCSIYLRNQEDQKLVGFHFGAKNNNYIKRLLIGEEQIFKNFIYSFYAEMSEHLKGSVYFMSDNIRENVIFYLSDNNLSLKYKVIAQKLQPKNFKLNYNSANQRLSPREIQCLKLLAQAKTAKEIGEMLAISHRTVESYFQDIKNKFNLQNRSELVELYEAIQRMVVY